MTDISSWKRALNQLHEKGRNINHLINNARSLDNLKINQDGETNRENFVSEYLLNVVVPYEISMFLFRSRDSSGCKNLGAILIIFSW